MGLTGEYIEGRLTDAVVNASPAPITFKDSNGNSVTVPDTGRIIITTAIISNQATAKDLVIFQDLDDDGTYDAGEELINVSFGGQDHVVIDFGEGLRLRRGISDVLVGASAAGDVDVLLVGKIVNS